MKSVLILISTFVFTVTAAFSQDTIAGWTFPVNGTLPISDLGNSNNKDNQYIIAARNNNLPFGTIDLTRTGFTSRCASISAWDTNVLKKAWVISIDASNYKAMKLFARISSDSVFPGPRDFKIQYMNGCCDPVWHDIPGANVKAGKDWTTGFVNGLQLPDTCKNMVGLQLRFLITSDTSTANVLLTHSGISMIDEIYVTGDKILSVDENIFKTLRIYPNPSSGIININSDLRLTEVSITDFTGRSIFHSANTDNNLMIDLSSVTKGLYFIKIVSGKDFCCKKIILY